MNTSGIFLTLVLTPVAGLANPVAGQSFVTPALRLFPAFVSTIDAAEAANPPLAVELRKASAAFSLLVDTLDNIPGGTPPEYERSFAVYQRELDDIQSQIASGSATTIAQGLTEDVQFKYKFVQGGFGMTVRYKALVLVRVKTLASGTIPVVGLRVSCNPRRYANAEPAMFIFDRLSPTETRIPPGNYTLKVHWLDKTVAARDITVGLSGRDIEEVEVAIPARAKK